MSQPGIKRSEPAHLRIQCKKPVKIAPKQTPKEAGITIIVNNRNWAACRKLVKEWNEWFEAGR